MAQDIGTSNDRGTGAKQGRVRVQPTRKVSAKTVCYPLPLSEIQFRYDSICVYIINLYGKPMSRYQIKVLATMNTLYRDYGYQSLSYYDIDKSGAIRGMNWNELLRSMQVLHSFGLLETFGRTQGGNHYKYIMSYEGDRLMGWIDSEMSCPSVTMTFKSKRFAAPDSKAA